MGISEYVKKSELKEFADDIKRYFAILVEDLHAKMVFVIDSLNSLSESHEQLRESHEQLRESHERLWESHNQLRESHGELRMSHFNLAEKVDRIHSEIIKHIKDRKLHAIERRKSSRKKRDDF